ncbi:hypothetical protein D3C72_1472710 [compost metagenome]
MLGRHLHAKVAARDHHRIGLGQNRLQAVDRSGLLQLGYDASTTLNDLPDLHDVGGALHERQRDPIDTQRESEVEVGTVLLGQRRQRQHHAWHVHALAVRQHATVDDARVGMVRAARHDFEPQFAVVEQQFDPGLERREDLRVRQRHTGRVTGLVAIEVEAKGHALGEPDRPGGEGADAQLRALQVKQHADRAAKVRFDGADQVEPLLVVGVGAMAEIQAEDVCARAHERLNGRAVGARRA